MSRLAPFSAEWLCLWAVGLAPAWLLPSHHLPWTAFHSDAWGAGFLLLAFSIVFVRGSGVVAWGASGLVPLGLALLVWLQFLLGMIPFIGDAWIVSAYLLGLSMAIQMGKQWEASQPLQALDGLALALGIAGVLSVVLQLVQWLDLASAWEIFRTVTWISLTIESDATRPFANMAQPNLLATLLLWAILSVAWGLQRGRLGALTALLLVALLLFGVALTRSRTAWLGVAILVLASWYWSALWRDRRVAATVTTLGLGFGAISAMLLVGPGIANLGDAVQIDSSRLAVGLRPLLWSVSLDAALTAPWFGHGWNQTAKALLNEAINHPPLRTAFAHSHNLVLDLVIWIGIPLGLAVAGFALRWLWSMFVKIRKPEDALVLLFILIVANHAMLELPLHYAFFLLPLGVMVGVLDQRMEAPRIAKTGRPALLLLAGGAAVFLGIVVRDYLGRIEPDFLAMRFEAARVGPSAPAEAPDVLVLTQLRETQRYWRYAPRPDMSAQEIEWAKTVTQRNPAPRPMLKFAQILAINGRVLEATHWLALTKKSVSTTDWKIISKFWLEASKTNPAMALVGLPAAD